MSWQNIRNAVGTFNNNLYNRTFNDILLDLLKKKNRETTSFFVGVLLVELRWVARRDFLMFDRSP